MWSLSSILGRCVELPVLSLHAAFLRRGNALPSAMHFVSQSNRHVQLAAIQVQQGQVSKPAASSRGSQHPWLCTVPALYPNHTCTTPPVILTMPRYKRWQWLRFCPCGIVLAMGWGLLQTPVHPYVQQCMLPTACSTALLHTCLSKATGSPGWGTLAVVTQ